jgi:hypothetical protein
MRPSLQPSPDTSPRLLRGTIEASHTPGQAMPRQSPPGVLVGWKIATGLRPVRGRRDADRRPCCDRPSRPRPRPPRPTPGAPSPRTRDQRELGSPFPAAGSPLRTSRRQLRDDGADNRQGHHQRPDHGVGCGAEWFCWVDDPGTTRHLPGQGPPERQGCLGDLHGDRLTGRLAEATRALASRAPRPGTAFVK